MNIIEYLKNPETYSVIRLTAGQNLFKEGDSCLNVGVVLAGIVKISTYADDGKEILYNQIGKDGLFGNNLIFSSQPYYKGNVTAVSDSRVALIPREKLLENLRENEAFLTEYLRIQSDFGKGLNSRIRLLSIDSVEERILFLLRENKGRLEYHTVTHLAEVLSITREAASRAIHRLERGGRIKLLPGGVMNLN